MATVKWEVVDRIYCTRIGQQAELLEERVYPDEIAPMAGATFQVRARKCSFGVECNLDGFGCRWSMTNPDYDPFER
jgi:hypothetical protein